MNDRDELYYTLLFTAIDSLLAADPVGYETDFPEALVDDARRIVEEILDTECRPTVPGWDTETPRPDYGKDRDLNGEYVFVPYTDTLIRGTISVGDCK